MLKSLVTAEALGHLEIDLKQARKDLLYAESWRQANHHVVSQRVDDVNALRAENTQQAQEIESLKARLAGAESKNRQTDDMIFGKPLFSEEWTLHVVWPR
jgi:hypothetical protein